MGEVPGIEAPRPRIRTRRGCDSVGTTFPDPDRVDPEWERGFAYLRGAPDTFASVNSAHVIRRRWINAPGRDMGVILRPADARAAAGDEGDLPREFPCHGKPRSDYLNSTRRRMLVSFAAAISSTTVITMITLDAAATIGVSR